MARTTATATIKHKMRGKAEVKEEKQKLSGCPTMLCPNGYATTLKRGKKMKQIVKLYRSVKKIKQKRQWRETTRQAARMIKRRASQ